METSSFLTDEILNHCIHFENICDDNRRISPEHSSSFIQKTEITSENESSDNAQELLANNLSKMNNLKLFGSFNYLVDSHNLTHSSFSTEQYLTSFAGTNYFQKKQALDHLKESEFDEHYRESTKLSSTSHLFANSCISFSSSDSSSLNEHESKKHLLDPRNLRLQVSQSSDTTSTTKESSFERIIDEEFLLNPKNNISKDFSSTKQQGSIFSEQNARIEHLNSATEDAQSNDNIIRATNKHLSDNQMKIEPWDKYEQIKLIKEQTLFKQLRRSLFFISNSKTSLQTSYGSPSKNASFLSEKPSHNKDSIFAHSTDAAADASNDSELSDSDSERYFSEALHRWEPPKTRQATIAADVELEGGGKGESLLCKLEETLIQCQWRKEDHELKKQKAKLKNKISTTYTDDNSTCANSTDSDSAKDFSEVDEDNTNTEFKERKLELIRKQIKEARRFKKEFGYWIKKMSVMDEEENAMWDEAEKKMEEDDERKERKWEMEEKNPTLEELKTMLCNAEKEGMSEQDVKELQNKIQRKEKKMEKKEIRKMLSDLERDQLKHLKRQTTTDYSLNNHSILQEATQTEKFESPLIFDFISPPSTPSAEIASDHSLSDRSQAFSSSSSRSLNCNTNSTKENSIFDVRISNKLIPQPSLFPTMSLFTFDEQFFKWIDSTVEEDPSNWVPTTKKPLLPAFPRIKHEFSPFRDFWLNINHFHPHIRATMNEHTIQRFSVQELVKAVASSDYLSFFPDEYFCSDASFHSDWIRYRQSLLASHIETKSIQRQNEGYGYITALSKAIPGHSSAAQRNPEMLLKMRKLSLTNQSHLNNQADNIDSVPLLILNERESSIDTSQNDELNVFNTIVIPFASASFYQNKKKFITIYKSSVSATSSSEFSEKNTNLPHASFQGTRCSRVLKGTSKQTFSSELMKQLLHCPISVDENKTQFTNRINALSQMPLSSQKLCCLFHKSNFRLKKERKRIVNNLNKPTEQKTNEKSNVKETKSLRKKSKCAKCTSQQINL